MSRFIVGVTGGIGSGKSAVAALFAKQGIVEVDTDRIAHRLTATGGAAIPDLLAAFGPEALDAHGALDRAAMRARVFSDPGARRRLEAILHPAIRAVADAQCAAAPSVYALLVVPLMAETWASGDYRHRCRRILVIDCSEATQVRRVMARNAMTEVEVRAVLAAQASRLDRLAIADDVIANDGARDELEAQVMHLHAEYLMLASHT